MRDIDESGKEVGNRGESESCESESRIEARNRGKNEDGRGVSESGGARFEGATSFTAIAGAGLFWAWVDTIFFTPSVYVPFPDAACLYIPLFTATVILEAALLAAVAFFPAPIWRALHGPRATGALCAISLLAGACIVASAHLACAPLTGLAAALSAFVFAAGFLSWGTIAATGGARTASVLIPASIALGALTSIAFAFMEPFFGVCLATTLPAASFVILHVLRSKPERFEHSAGHGLLSDAKDAPGSNDGAGGPSKRLTMYGIAPSVACAFALFGLALGYMQAQVGFGGPTIDSSRSFLLVRGIATGLLLVLTMILRMRPYLVYRVGLLAMAGGFMFLPFASQVDGSGMAGGVVVAAGYACFDVMAWSVIAETAHCSVHAPERTIAIGRAVIHVGVALGVLASAVLPALELDEVTSSVITTSVGYLLVIAVVICVGNPHGTWSALKYGSLYEGEIDSRRHRHMTPEERAEVLAARHGLTVREREVLGLLLAGRSARYIAEQLYISESTANSHVRHIYAKMDVHNKQELLDAAQEFDAREPGAENAGA